MTFSWNHELLDQLDFAWNHQFTPRMTGLTDDEYLWEPVDGCWSVRLSRDGRSILDGIGEWPDSPPFTTIAWRLAHIASFFEERTSNHFGDGSYDMASVDWPTAADAALSHVERAYRAWHAGVESLGEDGLFRPCGRAEGPYSEDPILTLVLHINREFLHHAAEIALLRDLYRDTVAKGTLMLNTPGNPS